MLALVIGVAADRPLTSKDMSPRTVVRSARLSSADTSLLSSRTAAEGRSPGRRLRGLTAAPRVRIVGSRRGRGPDRGEAP
jgi:hypothetical protein